MPASCRPAKPSWQQRVQKCGLAGLRAKFEISQIRILIGSVLIRRKAAAVQILHDPARTGGLHEQCQSGALHTPRRISAQPPGFTSYCTEYSMYIRMWHVGCLEVA